MTKNPREISKEEIEQKMTSLDGWKIKDTDKIYKEFSFKNFKQALDFTNKIGDVAEEMQHHPEISLSWGKVALEITTNDRGGLTELDFLYANKINDLLE